jgi:hypothetical protein
MTGDPTEQGRWDASAGNQVAATFFFSGRFLLLGPRCSNTAGSTPSAGDWGSFPRPATIIAPLVRTGLRQPLGGQRQLGGRDIPPTFHVMDNP